MNIGVDFHAFQGIFQGSIIRYLGNIYKTLTEIDKTNKYFFFVSDAESFDEGWRERGKIVGFETTSKFKRLSYKVPFLAKREKLDVFHFQYIAPLWCKCPVVLTVHDILFETHPQYFKKSFVLRSIFFIRRSIKKARHIFTVSEYCKNKIQELYQVRDDRISITPNAVEFDIFNTEGREKSKDLVLKKWGIQDFLLTVGRLDPRKNHVKLIRAYKKLSDCKKDIPKLVIVGQRYFQYDKIFKEITYNKLENRVKVIENADDEWLPHFYRASLLFCYPSFAEGFGIPPLEAMACGRPVICSNTTSLPEIVGDAALLVDPTNEEDIAEKIEYVIENPSVSRELSIKGLEQAKKFSWNKSAEVLLDVYNKL